MSVPEEEHEPARLQSGRFVARRHRFRVMIVDDLDYSPLLDLDTLQEIRTAHTRGMRSRAWSSGFSWLEHDHCGLHRAAGGVGVEVLVDLAPSGPQTLALASLCATCMDLSCSVAGLGDGIGMILQVQPPGGFGRTPPIHRHGDQVAIVLEVADDDVSRLPRASARRGES